MRIDEGTLREMAALLPAEERDEMAIPSYLHRNPALRWMAWRRVEEVARLLEAHVPNGGRVLDFGCGTGVLFEASLAHAASVIGVDLVLGAAQLWVDRRGLDRVALQTPEQARAALGPASVDLVVAAEVLEHLDSPEDTLAWFRRVLKPDGSLLISLPTENAAYRFGRRLAGFDGHFHKHNAASLDALIRRSGFLRRAAKHIPAPGPLSIYLVARYTPEEAR